MRFTDPAPLNSRAAVAAGITKRFELSCVGSNNDHRTLKAFVCQILSDRRELVLPTDKMPASVKDPLLFTLEEIGVCVTSRGKGMRFTQRFWTLR